VAEPFCLRWRKVDGEVHGDSLPWRRPVQRPASADGPGRGESSGPD
jgi:hypothetical protein